LWKNLILSKRKSQDQRERNFKALIMGIREHLSKDSEKDLKLSDLQFDNEEASEIDFDVSDYISEETLSEYVALLERMARDLSNPSYDFEKNPGQFEVGLVRLENLRIVSPEAFNDLSNTEIFLKLGKIDLQKLADGYLWLSYVAFAASLRIVFPEKMKNYDLGDSREIANKLKMFDRPKYDSGKYVNFKLVFPDDFDKMNFDMEQILVDIKDQLEIRRKGGEWSQFLTLAVNFKILFPERSSELKLDKDVWQRIRVDLLKQARKSNSELFSHVKTAMILAAEDVRVTEKGLELVMKKQDFKREEKPRPERKKF